MDGSESEILRATWWRTRAETETLLSVLKCSLSDSNDILLIFVWSFGKPSDNLYNYRTRHATPGHSGPSLWFGGNQARDCQILPAGGYQEDEAGQQILVSRPGESSLLGGFPDKAHSGELPGDSE